MSTREIFEMATKLGLRLEPRGNRLAVIPASRCPPDFMPVLRQHKRELLAFLDTERISLTPDCLPWLHIARQVLAGEFEGADRSTIESLCIGLRAVPHAVCERALKRIST